MEKTISKQINKFALGVFLLMAILSFGFKVGAYSGLLDQYSGTGWTIAGGYSADSWTTSGHAYVEHWVDRYDKGDGSMYVALGVKGLLGGYSLVSGSSQTVYGTGGNQLTFTLPSYNTYKLYFQAGQNYNPVDFHGNVWDYQ